MEQIINKKDFSYFIVDNWFSKEEEKLIWKELDFFTNNNMVKTSIDNVAINELGNLKGKSFRIYPMDIYNPNFYKSSHILNSTDKQKVENFRKLIKKTFKKNNLYRLWETTNLDTTFVSYYENENFYDEHFDIAAFTCLVWLYKEPKKFNGGDFFLTTLDERIKSKNNRLIFFPSWYNHKVSTIKMNDTVKELGYGRYTISTFYMHKP